MNLPLPPIIAMVELVAVLVVAAIAGFIGLLSVVMARAMKPTPAAERKRIRQYLAWLEERRHHAETHGYDDDMKARIEAELVRSREELVAVQAVLAAPAQSSS